jgi:hypothetical protein
MNNNRRKSDMQKRYIMPDVKILVLDKEYLAGNTQDSHGEQNPGTILGNEGFFDDEETESHGKTTRGSSNVWAD